MHPFEPKLICTQTLIGSAGVSQRFQQAAIRVIGGSRGHLCERSTNAMINCPFLCQSVAAVATTIQSIHRNQNDVVDRSCLADEQTVRVEARAQNQQTGGRHNHCAATTLVMLTLIASHRLLHSTVIINSPTGLFGRLRAHTSLFRRAEM